MKPGQRKRLLDKLRLEAAAEGLRLREGGKRQAGESEVIPQGYKPAFIPCNCCGKGFVSFDARYNRRCPSCQRRVDSGTIDL